MEIVRGGTKTVHRHTYTQTHTHGGPFYVLFFCENAETRLKIIIIYFKTMNKISSVAMAWSVESLPSNPAIRVRPGGVREFNSYPGTVYAFFVCVLSFLSSAVALTFCWLHIQGGPSLCICLVLWSRVCCSHYRHLTHGHLGCKSRGLQVLNWGG